MLPKYETKDSGKRITYKSGFTRDTDEEKPRFDLIPIELLTRLAELYTRGAKKYGDNNWKTATSKPEIERFKQSAWRHFIEFQSNREDEDHAVATIWNIISYEWHTKYKMKIENGKTKQNKKRGSNKGL